LTTLKERQMTEQFVMTGKAISAALLEATRDLESHFAAWETAIEKCLNAANNEDERSYWGHELRAIRRDGEKARAAIAKATGKKPE
jgi:hypothetical protein